MASENIILTDYLRLLTPAEISELTNTSIGDARVALTDLLNYKLDDDEINLQDVGAKILPFKRQDEQVEELVIQAGNKVVEMIDRFYKRVENAETALDDMGREVETSTFIIREKERFAYSQKKLKSLEVMNLYKKNLSIDIQQEKLIKDDMSKSTQSGILVNKKQA